MYIERDGAQLFSTTLGSGPDVVLLHPTPLHHGFWLPLAERLASHYRLILMDLRGHGRSTLGSAPLTMEKLAQDVHAILRAMGVGRAAFVGCSMGGYVLYEYWRRFAENVTALAPICGKPQSDTPLNRKNRREWMDAAQQPGGLERNFDRMADTLVGSTARQRHPEVRATARAMMNAASLEAMLAVQQCLMSRDDSVPTLPTISVPVFVVAGEEDQTSTPAEMRIVADWVDDAEFHLLPQAGHYAALEQPDTVAAILEEFLNRHSWQSSTKTVPAGAGPVH